MWNRPKESNLFEIFEKNAKIAGFILIAMGIVGILFPIYMSIATVVFVAWLLFSAGIISGYFTYITDKKDWLGWLKSIIMLGVALYMLYSPLSGVATIGLLLSIYFFIDAFVGFSLSANAYPQSRWWLWALNGLLSFGLGVFFVVGWPVSSLYLIGIFVGISLFFDGLALLASSKFFKNLKEF